MSFQFDLRTRGIRGKAKVKGVPAQREAEEKRRAKQTKVRELSQAAIAYRSLILLTLQAIVDFTELRAAKMKLEMRMMRRTERREEWRAQMERERLDLERERFEKEHLLTPETRRTVRDEFQTHIATLLSHIRLRELAPGGLRDQGGGIHATLGSTF